MKVQVQLKSGVQVSPSSHWKIGLVVRSSCARFILYFFFCCGILLSSQLTAQTFPCREGETDVMKYFVMAQSDRASDHMSGNPNPIYTKVFPNEDFAGPSSLTRMSQSRWVGTMTKDGTAGFAT
jgi:hypothetical protein